MLNAMTSKKCKNLDDINDILIVRKITERESPSLSAKETLEEETSHERDLDREQHLLAEEQEAIIRKQLQLLQADERGKQALISEIAAIKQKQEKRAEQLRYRQQALDIEKERAKRIALLPPPLPKSVKLLLKKYDYEPKPDEPDVQMPDELQVFHIKGVEPHFENKENILNPKELEAKQKMENERQMKAKKRFNEALKKDRQKEEYSKIMKQIQNSELHNRLEMAKSISSEKKCIPCPLSDKIQTVKKQTDMEDAAEKVFKKINNREHVIEDIEGYQDYYEEKYKGMNSDFECKMIDCIPSFVKENYEYLLEDESKFQGGRNFSGLDDSNNDVLNEAYIENSPVSDTLDGREKIDLAINQLDKLRSDLQTEYDQTVKPLLLASIDIPKKELSDKAVETELLKLSREDKAIGTDIQYGAKVTSPPSPPPYTDFFNSGVMAFKRRHNVPNLGSFRGMYIPDMHRRDVHYTLPPFTQSETPSSWSSSSYCSLPSQHGIPIFPNGADSIKCDICVAEREKNRLPHELPQGTVSSEEKLNKSITALENRTEKGPENAQLSEYVQQLAKKYLLAKATSSQTPKDCVKKSHKGSTYSSVSSNAETVCSAFEKEIIPKSKIGSFVEPLKSEKSILTQRQENVINPPISQVIEKNIIAPAEDKMTAPGSSETLVKQGNILRGTQEVIWDGIYDKMKNFDFSKTPVEYSEYDIEAKRIQLIKDVLSRKIPRFSLDLDSTSENSIEPSKDGREIESQSMPRQSGIFVTPHIYHELSTIQEMDSALTANSFQASQSKLSDKSVSKENGSIPKEASKADLDLSENKLKMASLLDPPDTSIAELAKSIHFAVKTEEAVQPFVPQTVSSESLNAASTTSKNALLAYPSLKTDSSSHSSCSVSSDEKMFSSSLAKNVKHTNLKDTKILPQYFSDVSDIPQKVSSSEKYGSSPSLLPSELFSKFSSSSLSSSSPSIPSSIDEKSERKKEAVHSLISGLIDSPAARSTQSTPYKTEIKSKGDKNTVVSGFINSSIPLSSTLHPSMNEPNLEDKNASIDCLVSGYISNAGSSETSGSRFFQAMTPHSDISSLNVRSYVPKLQSDVSEIKDFVQGKHLIKYGQQTDSEREKYTLMSGYINASDVSSSHLISPVVDSKLDVKKSNAPSLISGYIDDFETSDKSSPRIFRTMTPHSDISSPSVRSSTAKHQSDTGEKKDFAHSKQSRHIPLQSSTSNSSGDFQLMTPHSNISSPGERVNFTHHFNYDFSSSTENFKALTPRSMVSSPSLPGDETKYRSENASSGGSEFHPMNVRFDISTNSVSCENSNNQSNAIKKLPHLSYHLTLKAQLPGQPKHLEPFKQPMQRTISAVPGSQKKIYVAESQSNIHIERKSTDESSSKENARVCSSNFFVPHLCAADLPSSKDENNGSGFEGDTSSEEIDASPNTPKPIIDSQKAVFSVEEYSCPQNKETFLKMMKARAETVHSKKEIIEERGAVEEKSKELSLKRNFEIASSVNQQHSNLHAISSTSSSTENLSEISSSKVLYQSTPIKSIEEIAQEPGILEEPDLTLITTEYSCEVDSPEKPRKPLNSSTAKVSIGEEKDLTVIASENDCKTPTNQSLLPLVSADTPTFETPTNQSPQLLASADTPSMLSFLHHEISCMQTDDDPPTTENPNLTPEAFEAKTPTIGKQRTQFPRFEYKQRTKRLWNNLEEVKKRNLAKEREKLKAVNRLKAKEYAKKLTPKRKI